MKIIFLTIVLLTLGVSIPAQSPSAILEKAREIKILESGRKDVERILSKYKLEASDDSRYEQTFSNKNAEIEVSYANGKCSENADNLEEWNVSEWTVTSLEISFVKTIELKDTGINLSDFVKEKRYANVSEHYIYHNKDSGIAIEVSEKEVLRIYLIPRRYDYFSGCNREKAKEFYNRKSWFDSKLEERVQIIEYSTNVTDLTLSQTTVIAACPLTAAAASKSCPSDVEPIKISVSAEDSENDVLNYNYTVSGGKIIGEGAQVTWDLFGEPPGEYTITAGVDNGAACAGKPSRKR